MSKTGLINFHVCGATFIVFAAKNMITLLYCYVLLMGWILGVESKDIGSYNLNNLHHWFRSCLWQGGSKPFVMMYVAMDEIEREVKPNPIEP